MRKRAIGVAVTLLLAWLSAPGHAEPLEPARLLPVQSKLAFGLIEALGSSAATGSNVVVSPASAAGVFSVIDVGADAAMRSAIHRTLGFEPGNGAQADLEGLRTTVSMLQRDDGPLALANAIVFDPEAAPEASVLDAVRAAGAQASVADLTSPEALQRINDWVSTHTGGLIPSILNEAPREPGLVALNALHFKDGWQVPFDRGATRAEAFHMPGGQVDVPMMHAEGRFRFRQDAQYVAVDLPYATGGFALTLVTSRQQPLEAPGFADAAAWLDGSGFVEGPGEIAMPRFSLEETADMLAALDSLGLAPARTSPTALAGFSATAQTISRVVQKTVLQVDEAGTEAAAATAVTTLRSMPEGFVKLTADQPFLFALRDANTGLILLAGYVANPTPEAIPATAARDTSTRAMEAGSLDTEVYFGFDSADVSPAARESLSELARALRLASRQGVTVEISGHTDARGDPGYNQRLSEQRAQAVKDVFVADFDIDESTLVAVGYGQERLKNTDDSFAADNRRVEVKALAPLRRAGH